ncbi:competence protein CoiA [Amphibacillus sediminis]|uniref:competence protein CoiA n=1 Tax=Amphibacillus sediminis TaxID=360185 RepID=UPI00082B0F22|nr:competence protein CoiA family protein [Amphibacillus sediminis]
MLQAINSEGKTCLIALRSKAEITKLKDTESFYCPICYEPVLIRAGAKQVAHFAHKRDSRCFSSMTGEGPYHQQGKLDLFQWLTNQGYQAKLETYFKDIKQRADLSFSINQKQYVIEFQCANISPDILIKRTLGFQSIKVNPLWILGGNQITRFSGQGLRLNMMAQACLNQYPDDHSAWLTYYCPVAKQFAHYSAIALIGDHKSYGHLTFLELRNSSLLELLGKSKPPFIPSEWLYLKRSFRTSPRSPRLSKSEKAFHKWLYQHSLHPSLLSSWVGLPVQGQWKMRVPIWHWQTILCYGFLNGQQTFYYPQLKQFIAPYVKTIPQQPLVFQDIDPIKCYLNYFLKVKQIVKITKDFYRVLYPIQTYQTLPIALKKDQYLLKKLDL